MVRGTVCVYRGCSSKTGTGKNISLFKFPNDVLRSRAWLTACNREDLLDKSLDALQHHRLCEKHFEEKFISKGGARKRLFEQAIPTIFPHNTTYIVTEEDLSPAEVQTTDEIAMDCSPPLMQIKPAECTEHLSSQSTSLFEITHSEPGPSPIQWEIPSCSGNINIQQMTMDVSSPPLMQIKPLEYREHLSSQSTSLENTHSEPGPSSVQWEIPSCSRNINIQQITVDVSNEGTRQKKASTLLSPSAGTQTSAILSSSTPRKVKLREKIKSLRKVQTKKDTQKTKASQWTVEDFFKMCDTFLSKSLADIVKSQATLKDKKPIGRRYSLEYKQFALTLYFLGPRAYAFIKKILFLPSKRTLQRITEKLVCRPGLANESVFKALEIKIKSMLDLDRHCMICIDEMSLKANLFYHTGRDEIVGIHDLGLGKKDFLVAQNASVIMARGLYQNWKQPIAYFFVNTQFRAAELHPVLESCVTKLSQIGLHVDVLISDMGSNFIQLAKSLNVSPDNSEFQIGGYTVIYLFDTCHLLKATKNNLILNIFSFGETKTSWTFVEQFYNMDKKQAYRCAPKLTDAHIYPSNFDKMRVKLAVQVLSHTVASGMNTYVSLGALPRDALGTIEVIEKFNNLFDLLNSSASNSSNKFKNFFEGSDFQLQFLNEMINFLDNLQIFNKKGENVTNKCKFKKCWIVTIQGIKQLWHKLSEAGFKYLRTRRVNQDCLENYFGNIRQQGGNCINPTPIQFERAFKKLFCQSYLHSNQMNCQDDLDELLTKLQNGNLNVFDINTDINLETKAISLPDYDYRKENITTQNAFTYVCGYLIKKSLNIHKCPICIGFSKESESHSNSQLLTLFRAYDTDRSIYGGLRTPDEIFLFYIYQLEQIFVSLFDQLSTKEHISKVYVERMQTLEFLHPCSNYPKDYVIKLFIRMRIFYTLKYANRDLKFSKKSGKKNRKISILSHI